MPLLTLVFSIALTAVATWFVRSAVEHHERSRLHNAMQAAHDRIRARMDAYEAMLLAGSGLFHASESVDGASFRAFVAQLDLANRYPGVLGIGFTRRLGIEEREAWIAHARRDHPDFRIWPEDPRDEWHTITWLEPLGVRNKAAIGYDMYTEPVRREAMDRARDTGQPALSGRVILVQEIDENKQPGFLMYVPVYRGPAKPTTVEERRRDLVGFVYSPFRAGDLFRGIFGSETSPRVTVAIYDGETADPRSFLARTGGEGSADAMLPMEVAGRRWHLAFRTTEHFAAGSRRPLVRVTLLTGLGMSGLLFGLSFLQLRARSAAERLSEERAHALQERMALLASESEARSEAQLLNDVMRAMASELDEEKLVQLVTDESTRATGAAFGAFFWNVTNERGESFMLYTLSGASREAFSKFPLPRNTAIFEPTFSGRETVRIDDVTKDPRYGKNPPYRGMPEGHLPVRSYLAVPVKSRTGTTMGGLFFGHPEPGRFVARHERVVVGLAAQAAIALDNARLFRATKESERRKDEFLAMLAHELRNPLTPIVTAIHMMKMRPSDETVLARARSVIERQTERMVRLVDDLLDVSRITRGKIQLRKEPVDLREVISRAIASTRPIIEAREHELETALPPEPILVEGDAVRLEQVVANLLHNAAKYTDPRGKVRVGLSATGGQVTLSVRDTGMGIPKEFLPHVFDLFSQSDRTLDRSQGGLGIGLTLVRTLVDLHGGQVEARSEGPGKGSEFFVRLPQAAATAAPEARAEPRRKAGGARLRVLLVEDSADNAATLKEYLELVGHEVRVAHSGPAGIDLAIAHPPDVVVLDIGLPGMDGYEVAQRLRRQPELADVRIVGLSGYARESDRERSRAAGFDEHLAKPVSPEALAAALAP